MLYQHVAQTCGALRLSVTFWALEQDKGHPIWVFRNTLAYTSSEPPTHGPFSPGHVPA